MNDQIRLSGTVQSMTELATSFEMSPGLYMPKYLENIEMAEETLKNMTERLHHHHHMAKNINIRLDGSGSGNITAKGRARAQLHLRVKEFHECKTAEIGIHFKC